MWPQCNISMLRWPIYKITISNVVLNCARSTENRFSNRLVIDQQSKLGLAVKCSFFKIINSIPWIFARSRRSRLPHQVMDAAPFIKFQQFNLALPRRGPYPNWCESLESQKSARTYKNISNWLGPPWHVGSFVQRGECVLLKMQTPWAASLRGIILSLSLLAMLMLNFSRIMGENGMRHIRRYPLT